MPVFLSQITVSFDETTTLEDVDKLFGVFALGKPVSTSLSFVTFFFKFQLYRYHNCVV